MPSYYTVVQYVPDPVIDERINVGVVVFGDAGVQVQFLRDWQRPQRFGRQDVAFLRQFANRLEHAARERQLRMASASSLDGAAIQGLVGKWKNSIQFTEPRASLEPQARLLTFVAQRFLRAPIKRRRRGRRTAIAIATQSLRAALRRRSLAPRQLLRTHAPLRGHLDEHVVDIALASGSHDLTGLAYGFSFEGPKVARSKRELDAACWAIDDITKGHPGVRVGVLTLSRRDGRTEDLEAASGVFSGLGAVVADEADADDLAEELVSGIST